MRACSMTASRTSRDIVIPTASWTTLIPSTPPLASMSTVSRAKAGVSSCTIRFF